MLVPEPSLVEFGDGIVGLAANPQTTPLAEIVPHGIAGYAVAPNKDEISESIIDFFENNKAEFFKSGIKAEKEKYSWSKFIDAFKGLISRTK